MTHVEQLRDHVLDLARDLIANDIGVPQMICMAQFGKRKLAHVTPLMPMSFETRKLAPHIAARALKEPRVDAVALMAHVSAEEFERSHKTATEYENRTECVGILIYTRDGDYNCFCPIKRPENTVEKAPLLSTAAHNFHGDLMRESETKH